MSNLPAIKWGEDAVQVRSGFPIHLTLRQREILLLLCEGLTNKHIARRLNLSDATVKSHVASVLRSLNVATRLEAVAISHRMGLVHCRNEQREIRADARGIAMLQNLRSAQATTLAAASIE